MGGIDFVISVGTDQHQMLHVRLGQEVLEQIQRCCVEPLQVVEETGPADAPARANTLMNRRNTSWKRALRILWRENEEPVAALLYELQFGNQIDDKLPVGPTAS